MTVEPKKKQKHQLNIQGKQKKFANKKWRKIIKHFCYLEDLTLIPKKF